MSVNNYENSYREGQTNGGLGDSDNEVTHIKE